MHKLGIEKTHRRSAVRERMAQVRKERYERLEQQLFEKAITELEVEINSRRLCGPVPSILATAATLLIPTGLVLVLLASVPGTPWYALALAGIATSSLVSWIGGQIWKRSSVSTGLPFQELMLWTWIRHHRAEKELLSNAQRLGLSRSGEFVAASPLTNEEELAVLYRLNAALELKDSYTLGHSRRVAKHSYRIALQLGLPAAEVETLRLAAELHDIGKLVVPDAVLTKNGKLDDHERELINQHSAAGAKILSILDRPDIVATVRHHHERWDGAGYPDGVSGSDIPLMARVIAVADTYDAITSSRPYRDRASRRRAVTVIREERGSQFDPEVADAFLRTLHQHPLLPIFGLLMSAPQRLFERVAAWIGGSGQVASAAAGVAGVALVTASSISGAMPSPRAEKPQVPVAVPAAAQPADDVLGTRIVKEPTKASVAGRERDRAENRKRPAAKSNKEERDGNTGTRPTGDVQRSSNNARPAAPAPDEPAPEKETAAAAPAVAGDPEPLKGKDCARGTDDKVAQGHLLHCP